MLKRLMRGGAVLATIVAISACATGNAMHSAKEAADHGDWDSAVAYYREALNSDPSRVDIKVALERAMRTASAEHLKRAHAYEAQDQLSAAAAEYRMAADLDPGNTLALTRALDIEKRMRDQVEASRPRAHIDDLRQQAAQNSQVPRLDPRVRVTLSFSNASVKDIINTICAQAGINVTYDQTPIATINSAYPISLQDASLEEALNQVMTANSITYKVQGPRSIFVYADNPQNRQKYEDQFSQTFYLSNADPSEIVQIITQVIAGQNGPAVRPVIFPNKTANAVVVKATAPVMALIGAIIDANDKPRAEVMIDVEILEVDRNRARDLGLELSNYALGFSFSPALSPTGTAGTFPPAVPPPFPLNTISRGVSGSDFYMTVPSAQIKLLESDTKTRLLAKPQIRGRENAQISLNLGSDIPVPSTTFLPVAAGGVATTPQVSYTYRSVGVNLQVTPRVTYQDEIVLTLMVERSALGPNVDVAGQSLPSFVTRHAQTELRLRDGESNLLAGLLSQDDSSTLTGFPGIMQIPLLRSLFGNTNSTGQSNDIVMIVTPHIVRSHELTQQDVRPLYLGTGQNFGGGAVPSLVSSDAPPPPQPAVVGGAPTGAGTPAGAPTTGRGAGAGAAGAAGQPTPPAAAATPPDAPRAVGIVPLEPVNPAGAPAPAALPAQIVVTAPTQALSVGGVPGTVPITITGVSQMTSVSLTVTYNANVVKAASVSQGMFMQQGGVSPTFTQKTDTPGRVDIAIARTGDQSGASGTGLLAGIVFSAVAPGTSQITITAVALNAAGQPIAVQVVPATITVR